VAGKALDPKVVGGNSMVELFQTKAGSEGMTHTRTWVDKVISTPNRVQGVNDHAFASQMIIMVRLDM
jgi:hypothetical protein